MQYQAIPSATRIRGDKIRGYVMLQESGEQDVGGRCDVKRNTLAESILNKTLCLCSVLCITKVG